VSKILVVDDEKNLCEEFRGVLEAEHHEVETCTSGKEAVQKVKKKDFDLVFLDVLMPKMEGREAYEKIRKVSSVPVAIMSGYLTPTKEREILGLGAIACFRKPLDLKRILSLLKCIASQQSFSRQPSLAQAHSSTPPINHHFNFLFKIKYPLHIIDIGLNDFDLFCRSLP